MLKYNTPTNLSRSEHLERLVATQTYLHKLHNRNLYLSPTIVEEADIYIGDCAAERIHVGSISRDPNGQICLSVFQDWIAEEVLYVQ